MSTKNFFDGTEKLVDQFEAKVTSALSTPELRVLLQHLVIEAAHIGAKNALDQMQERLCAPRKAST